jgi:hypothetical protein
MPYFKPSGYQKPLLSYTQHDVLSGFYVLKHADFGFFQWSEPAMVHTDNPLRACRYFRYPKALVAIVELSLVGYEVKRVELTHSGSALLSDPEPRIVNRRFRTNGR